MTWLDEQFLQCLLTGYFSNPFCLIIIIVIITDVLKLRQNIPALIMSLFLKEIFEIQECFNDKKLIFVFMTPEHYREQ